MKYKTIIVIVATAAVLSACSSNGANIISNQELSETNKQSEQTEVLPDRNDDDTEDAKTQSQESGNQEKWSSLPEYDIIIQYIGNKPYTFETVSDDEEKRVLLLIDEDGDKNYKTVFIKNSKRLKIININGEGQSFNEVIAIK